MKTVTKDSQTALEFKDAYDYQAIVTNMEDLSPEEIWHWYNKRCNVENKIDELKTGWLLTIDECQGRSITYVVKTFLWQLVLTESLKLHRTVMIGPVGLQG